MKRGLLILTLLLFPLTASAQALFGGVVPAAGVPVSYTGPGDIAAFTAFYSLARGYSAAYSTGSNNGINLRRASDNATTNLVVLSNGSIDVASWNTFCVSTTCFLTEAYDETGNGRPVLQATAANQCQAFSSGGANNQPYCQTTAAVQQQLTSGNFTPSTAESLFAVYDRASGTGNPLILTVNGNNRILPTSGSANSHTLHGAGACINATAADATWHVAVDIINGASPNSLVNIDGTETTGSCTLSTASAQIGAWEGNASATLNESEAGFVDAVAWSSSVRKSVCDNAAVFYNTTIGANC